MRGAVVFVLAFASACNVRSFGGPAWATCMTFIIVGFLSIALESIARLHK